MKTELIDKGQLSSQLTITIHPEDYNGKLESELKKHKNEAHLKGFRKGKAPLSVIKKFYGKNILANVIDSKIQETLSEYIVNNKLDLLGNPIPAVDQEPIDFDLANLGDFSFAFDLGFAPQFEVKGASASDTHPNYIIKIDEADIIDELESLRKRHGNRAEVDSPIELMDVVHLTIVESRPIDEESTFTSEFPVLIERLNDDVQAKLIGKKKGSDLDINVYELEKNAKEEYVKKYFLKDAPENVTADFKATVTKIIRVTPAELNEEFFEKAFANEDVKNEADAKAKIREYIEHFYKNQSDSITRRFVLESLVGQNNLTLPDEFLKRWLIYSNENVNAADIDAEYPAMVQNLTWTLIKKQIAEKEDIKVTSDEIKEQFRVKFEEQLRQWGYGSMEGINMGDIVDRMMQNQEEVEKTFEEIRSNKVMDSIMNTIQLSPKEVTKEEYQEIVKKLNENNA
jgi:trigger factor